MKAPVQTRLDEVANEICKRFEARHDDGPGREWLPDCLPLPTGKRASAKSSSAKDQTDVVFNL